MFKSIHLANIDTLRDIENERVVIAELDDVSRWIDLAISSIPTLAKHQKELLRIEEYFEETGLEGDDLHLWRAYRNLFAQRFSGVYDDILEVTDVITSDLFKYFISHIHLKDTKSRFSTATIPLTFLGRTEDYYFTYTHDMERPIAVISIPQGRVSSIWNWLAIPHEIGHNIFEHFIDYERELWSKIKPALEKQRFKINRINFPSNISGKQVIQIVWRFWLDELVADIFGVLFTGPAFVMSRHDDAMFAAEHSEGISTSIWNVNDMEMSKHPVPFIRPLIGSRILSFLGFDDIANTLNDRWLNISSRYLSENPKAQDELLWIDYTHSEKVELFTIPVDELLRSFDTILHKILFGKMKCLGDMALTEIIMFDNLDNVISKVVADELSGGIDEFAKYVKPRHLIAASRMAFEKEPELADIIHASAMRGLIYYKNHHIE